MTKLVRQTISRKEDEINWRKRLKNIESVVVYQKEQIQHISIMSEKLIVNLEAKNKLLELQMLQLHKKQQQQQMQIQMQLHEKRKQSLTEQVRPLSITTNFHSAQVCQPVTERDEKPQRKKKRLKKSMIEDGSENNILREFSKRKHLPRELHSRVAGQGKSKNRRSCVYCSYLYLQKKKTNKDMTWDSVVKRTNSECSYCKVVLCREHFHLFHELP